MHRPRLNRTVAVLRSPRGWFFWVGGTLALTVLHFAAAKASLHMGAVDGTVAPIWPASGLALAALVLFGLRLWPAVAVGAAVANGLSDPELLVLVGATAANTLEAVAGAWLIRRFRLRASFERIVDVVGVLMVAAVAAALAASIGTLSLWAGGGVASGFGHLWHLWRLWWLGDATGILLLAPLVLVWVARPWPRLAGKRIEGLLLLALTGFGAYAVFSGWGGEPYFLFPFIVWAALRFQKHGAVAITALVAAIAVPYTARGYGAPSDASLIERLVLLDGFLVVLALSGLVVAVVESERRHAYAERARSQERYRLLVENSKDMTSLLDSEGRVLYASPSYERLLGYTLDEYVGSRALDYVHPDDRQLAEQATAAAFAGETGAPPVTRLRRQDGSWLWVEGTATLMPTAAGERITVLTTTRDVSARVEAEAALRESEAKFRSVFEQGQDAMLVADDQHRYVDANPAACALLQLSREEIIGRRIEDVSPASPLQVEEAWQGFLAQGKFEGAWHLRRGDGSTRQTDLAATANVLPDRHLLVMRDVTERNRLEEQLRQSQKMEAIGQLAGGIAHDFNNLLMVISGRAELTLNRLDGRDERLVHDMGEMLGASEQARELTRQLLAFSRRQVLKPQTVDLSEVVDQTEALLRRLIGEDIRIVNSLDARLGCVKADPSQIGQVLMNLALNARDAMPDGGTLTIEATNLELDERAGEALFGAPPGSYVMLTVTDTGCGMDTDTKTRAFDPFYTTKRVGEGTGLGLSTVYGIVKQSGGYVSVESEPGEGATFKIYLPRTYEAKRARATGTDEKLRKGSEAILLVEDEDVVRTLVAEMLEQQGYEVAVASHAAEALALADTNDPYDLLITDVVMPGMNGRELAARLLPLWPALKVIYTSGYTSPAIVPRGALEDDIVFLQKPFTMAELAAKLGELLDTPRAA